jgi:hypothetical protein
VHLRDGRHDQGIEALAEPAFPVRQSGDVGRDRGVAVALPDLRVAADSNTGWMALAMRRS